MTESTPKRLAYTAASKEDESENEYPHIVAPHDGNLILPPAAGQIVDPHDSDWWYSTPVQKTTQQFARARLNRTA